MDTATDEYPPTQVDEYPGTHPPEYSGTQADEHLGTQDDEQAGLSLQDAASQLGVSINTLRRWIKAGKIRSEKIQTTTGFAYLVYPDTVDHLSTHDQDPLESAHHLATQWVPDLVSYNRSLLEPLVTQLADQGLTIREQAQQIGQQIERIRTLEEQLATSREPWWRRLFSPF